MDCRRAGTGNGFCCDFTLHKHGSDGTGTEESGWHTSGAIYPFVILASLSQMTPRQRRADEQVHSRCQGCSEHSGELVG